MLKDFNLVLVMRTLLNGCCKRLTEFIILSHVLTIVIGFGNSASFPYYFAQTVLHLMVSAYCIIFKKFMDLLVDDLIVQYGPLYDNVLLPDIELHCMYQRFAERVRYILKMFGLTEYYFKFAISFAFILTGFVISQGCLTNNYAHHPLSVIGYILKAFMLLYLWVLLVLVLEETFEYKISHETSGDETDESDIIMKEDGTGHEASILIEKINGCSY